jgi:ketosteroid isomerase-like protein
MNIATLRVMRRAIPGLAVLTVSLLPPDIVCGQSAAGTVEQDVMKLEELWNDVAAIKKDRAMLEQIIADDFFYTHSNGSMANKAQEIADTISSQWTSSKTDAMKVHVVGDVAIVTGRQVLLGTSKGYASGPRRFMDVFVRRNGKWQVVGGQTTILAAQ